MKHFGRTLLLIFLTAALARAADVCRLAPGWRSSGPPQNFSSENLFEYLDGGAEGYLIFGFVRLEHQTCTKGEESLVIDISEMADSDAAYGLFAARRDPRQPVQHIGMGGEILAQRASFARGNSYVELTATPGEDYRETLRALVAALEKQVEGRSAPPDALAYFPTENLTNIRLVPESVLGLRPLRRGFVAEYPEGQAFLVTESSNESAAAVLEALRKRFGAVSSVEIADEAFEFNDKYLGGLCIFRKGRYLAGYAHAPDSAEAVARARNLATHLP